LVGEAGTPGEGELDESEVAAIFGIEIDPTKPMSPPAKASVPKSPGRATALRPAAGAKKLPAAGKGRKAKAGKKATKIAGVKKGRRRHKMMNHPVSGLPAMVAVGSRGRLVTAAEIAKLNAELL
jgi:hypothetical protein